MTSPNEDRAERAYRAVLQFTDRQHETDDPYGMETDLSDLLADMLHLADQYGDDHDRIIDRARRAYEGDMEDGPRVEVSR